MSYAFNYDDGDGTERIVFDTLDECTQWIESNPEIHPYIGDIYYYDSPF